jgi:tetratricopeptide (TPR) repeat protein
MTKRLNHVARRLLLVLCPLLTPQFVFAQDATPCELADQLAKAGELRSARVTYEALLKATPELDCARNGLDETRTRRLASEAEWQKGLDLLLSKQQKAARESLLTALEIDPSRDDVRQKLGSMLDAAENKESDKDAAETGDVYALANALLKAGYEKEAKDAAQNALKSDPKKSIPEPLKATKPTWFEQLETWMTGLWTLIGTGTKNLIGILLFLWIGSRLARLAWGLLPWGRPQLGQVTIDKFEEPTPDLGIGRDLTEWLANELAAKSPAVRIVVVGGQGANPIPLTENTLPTQLNFLVPLLNWIRTPKKYCINGVIHAPLDDQVALTVNIHNHRGELEARNFFTNPFSGDQKAAYRELGTHAGAWALFELDRIYFRKKREETKILGTTHWLSYALFRCGELASPAVGRSDAEMKFFHEALAEDHNNIGALIVIGDHQARKCNDDAEMKKGIDHLERARKRLDETEPVPKWGLFKAIPHTHINPLWFQATYALAVAYVHHSAQHEVGSRTDALQDLKKGIKYATELAVAIGATQLTLHDRWARCSLPVDAQHTLQQMLNRDMYYLLGVLAGAKASEEWLKEEKLKEREKNASSPTPGSGDNELWKWLQDLNTENLHCARDLVAPLEICRDKIGWPAYYNLACFYSRAREYETSFSYLEQYFEHLDLEDSTGKERAKWARKDPTLRPTREQKKDAFDNLLRSTNKDDKAHPPTPSAPQGEWVVEHCFAP